MVKPVGWRMEAGNCSSYFNELLGYIRIYETPPDSMGSEFITFIA